MVGLRNGEFGRVLDRENALMLGDQRDEAFGERRLAGSRRPGNDDVAAAGDGAFEKGSRQWPASRSRTSVLFVV